jgi:hypothetical protein
MGPEKLGLVLPYRLPHLLRRATADEDPGAPLKA